MPRPKDHRDVAINTLVSPVPRMKWAQFTVHFDSAAELGRSSITRMAEAQTVHDESIHQARIVDENRVIGTVRWERIVTCNPHSSFPQLEVIVDDSDPASSGAPIMPSRAPDRAAIWDNEPEVTCQLRMWADAEQGFSATIGASQDPPYTIVFRESATGTTHSFTLDARFERVTVVPSRILEATRGLARKLPA